MAGYKLLAVKTLAKIHVLNKYLSMYLWMEDTKLITRITSPNHFNYDGLAFGHLLVVVLAIL